MKSPILTTAARYLMPLLLLFSVGLLVRGHDNPGGGFVGGLVASMAFALHAVAFRIDATRKALYLRPTSITAVGIATAGLSGLPGLLSGKPWLTAYWSETTIASIKLGAPLAFDLGVYLTVVGSVVTMLFVLADEP